MASLPAPTDFLHGDDARYRIVRELGRGSMGLVYEAYDTRDGTSVALKTISANPHAEAEHLYRLKQEFRALADLEHPNLVRFGELASHRGQWFFTMELVRGRSFVEYVRPLGTLDEPRLRAALAQLVSAIAAIHEAGQLHRDVKPHNVLVTDTGRVVVLDFGLVTARTEKDGGEDDPSGTPDYMAPEQVEGLPLGPPADWYAVGMMIFVALTGRLAFVGDMMDILSAKLTREAPAPEEFAPDVPPDLAALCVDLLQRDARARPGADQIRGRLGLPPVGSGTFIATDWTHSFVGRERELKVLAGALREVAAGRAKAVAIDGEPGIGKSALVQQFLTSISGRALLLCGRCYEQESVPFKGIDAIVDAISQHLVRSKEDEVQELLAGGVRYLATVFPVLNRVSRVAEARSNERAIDNPMALREQAFGELERLVAAIARRRTVVLFLDDLQWSDRDSLALLQRVIRPEGAGLLFLSTMRTGVDLPAGASALLDGAERISLGGLSDSESRTLCAELSRTRGDPEADEGALVREAAGHPLFLAELLRSARRSDRPRSTGATKLQEVLWERIQERDPIERRFLEVLALAGSPIPYEVIAKAAAVDVGECQTRLGAMRAAQLVRISRRGDERLVVPYHDRVREAILMHGRRGPAGAERDASLHLSLGRALLESTALDALSSRVFVIVQHLNAGRESIRDAAERKRLVELNLLATREALLATAYESARTYAAIGLAILGDSAWEDSYANTRDLHLERMRAEFLDGDVALAKKSFDRARERITSPSERTDLYVTWIELEFNRGDFAASLASGRERLREIGVRLPQRVSPVSVLLQYIATRWAQRGRSPDDLRDLPVSVHPLDESALKVLVAVAPAAYWISSNLVGWISLKLARMTMRRGATDASAYGLASYGVILAGAFRKCLEAAAFGRLALTLHERFPNVRLTAKLLLLEGQFLSVWVRPFAENKKTLEASYRLAVRQGDTTYEGLAACCLSHMCALESADLKKQEEISTWARDVSLRRQDFNTAGSSAGHLRFAAGLRGTAAIGFRSDRAVDPAFLALAGEPAKSPSAYGSYWVYGAWLAYLFGEIGVAEIWLDESLRYEHTHFGHAAMLDLCFLRCLVAAKVHDRASWPRRVVLRAAISRRVRRLREWANDCPANFEAHHLIARAELSRVRGDLGEAETLLKRAVASAHEHGAVLREALAWELASAVAAMRGDGARAAEHRNAAIDAYERCGATAKVARLHAGAATVSVQS